MHTATRHSSLIKYIACVLICTFSLHTQPAHGEASQDRILLVNSSQDTLYQDYANLVQSYLEVLGEGRYNIEITSLNRLNAQLEAGRYRLIITSGARAAEQLVARAPDATLLLTFIPSIEYLATQNTRYRCQSAQCTILFLDQPPQRQMRFVRMLFGDKTRLGLLRREDNKASIAEYERLAPQFNIRLVPIAVHDSDEVVNALQKSVDEIDVLLAHPDTQLINRHSAKGILLTTYYNRVPLLGYSSSFVNAGATAGLYSAPDELARHAAETAMQLLQGKPTPRTAYPKYFRVEVNARVSQSLGLNLPSVATILDELRHD